MNQLNTELYEQLRERLLFYCIGNSYAIKSSAKDAQFAARNFVAEQHRSCAENVLCTFFILYTKKFVFDRNVAVVHSLIFNYRETGIQKKRGSIPKILIIKKQGYKRKEEVSQVHICV